MDIIEQLKPVWNEIAKKANITGNIGTSIQNELHYSIRPLLPKGIGYFFDFDMSGRSNHIFYELNNPDNKLIL